MNFTKTVPTEPGFYHAKMERIVPRIVHVRHDGKLQSYMPNGGEACPLASSLWDYLWGPRIDPPQPVPVEVMEAVSYLRGELQHVAAVGIGRKHAQHLKTLCDHIAPPEVPPLPRRFRGTLYGRSIDGVELPNGKRIWTMQEQLTGCSYDYPNGRSPDLIITEWIDKEQSDG